MTALPKTPVSANAHQEPVDRSRRSNFVIRTVWFCLAASIILSSVGGLGFFVTNIDLIKTVIDSLGSVALGLSLAYITGSVVDYNGGIGGMLGRDKPVQHHHGGGHPPQQHPDDYDPSYPARYPALAGSQPPSENPSVSGSPQTPRG